MTARSPEERAAIAARIQARTRALEQGTIADRFPAEHEPLADRVRECEADIAGIDDRLEAYDARFAALFTAMTEACRAAGLPVPGEVAVRRHLRLVREDESA